MITELWRFPVKSMQGERLETAELTERGMVGDRAWAVVGADDGQVASAKNPRKWGGLLHFSARTLDDGTAEITTPDSTTVRTDDADVDAFLSDAVGRAVRLVSAAPAGSSYEMLFPTIEGAAPDDYIASTRIADDDDGIMTRQAVAAFAPPGTLVDVAPLHIVATATLAAMDVDVRRLRPNVVVDAGDAAYVENGWSAATIALGRDARAEVAIPTMRCVMTTLGQPGIDADRGVLQRLVKANRIDILGGKWAAAGAYATVSSPGAVRVGDATSVSGTS